MSSAVGGHGNIYIGCEDHKLYALSSADGSIKWGFDTGGKIWTSATAVEESDFKAVFITSEHHQRLYSINPSTKNENWHVESDLSSPFISSSNYTRYHDISGALPLVCYTFTSGFVSSIRAVNAETGEVIWEDTIGNISKATPMIASGKVYVGIVQLGEVFREYYPQTGHVLFSYTENGELPGAFTSGVAHVDPKPGYPQLIITSTRDQTVFGYDIYSREEKWTTILNDSGSIIGLALTILREPNVLIVSQLDNLYALDPDTGVILWHYPYGKNSTEEKPNAEENRIRPRPVIWGDYVIHCVGGDPWGDTLHSELYIISLSTGIKEGSIALDGHLFSSPVVINEILYIGCTNGSFYAFSQG